MPLRVGVKLVRLLVLEIRELILQHRIQSANGMQIDDRHAPYVSGFLDGIDIRIQVLTAFVLVTLIGLHVAVAEDGIRTVKRGKQDDLLVGIQLLYALDADIDSALERIVREHRRTMLACNQFFGLASSSPYLFVGFCVPLAYRHSAIEIVGAQKHEDSVYILTMFGIQLLYLASHVVPFASADTIYIRCDLEQFLQEVPILAYIGQAIRVGDGVANVAYLLTLPRVRSLGL